MSFTRWLYMNNQEKVKVLLYIIPVLVLSYLLDMVLGPWFILSLAIGFLAAVPILAYKNLWYVNIIASKYDEQLTINYKQVLKQSFGSWVVNGLFAILLIVIVSAIGLLAIASGVWLLMVLTIILAVGALLVYVTIGKLAYYVILSNIKNDQLAVSDYFNNFVDIYKDNFKFVLITTIKAAIYTFIIVVLLSFGSIAAYTSGSTVLFALVSLAISFVVYWVDITVIQNLAREYTK